MADDKKGKKNQDENLGGFGDDDDNFGLPDLDYEPIDRSEETEPEPEKPKRGRPKKATTAKKTPAKKAPAKKTAAKKTTAKKSTAAAKKTTPKKAAAKPKAEPKKEEPVVEETPVVVPPVEETVAETPVEETPEAVADSTAEATPSSEPDFSFDDSGFEDESETTADDFDLKYSDVNEDDEKPKPVKKKEEEEKKSMAPIIISLVILVLVIGGILGYLFWYKPMQDQKQFDEAIALGTTAMDEGRFNDAQEYFNQADGLQPDNGIVDEKLTELDGKRQAAAAAKKAEEEAAAKAAEEARLAAEAEAEAAKQPEAGTVERLTERTGMYYVVVASSIDGDLATDHANRLAKNGVGVQILSPIGNVKYHRVTIHRADTYQSAQDQADQLKAEYNGAWVVKY